MDTRLAGKALTKPQLDMFVMGQLVAFSFSSEATSTNKKMAHERKRCYTNYHHQGKPVCQDMFRVVNATGSKHLRNLSSWLTDSGISPRVHGNTKRLPKHALKLRDVEYIVRFLLSYAEQHALLLPGRVPVYARDDIPRACLDGMSGRSTRGQLRRILPSMLLHTQHSQAAAADRADEADDRPLLDVPAEHRLLEEERQLSGEREE